MGRIISRLGLACQLRDPNLSYRSQILSIDLLRILFLALVVTLFLSACQDRVLERQIVRFPSKQIKEVYMQYRAQDGTMIKHGVYKEFYWNGAPYRSVYYVDGKVDSVAYAWHPNGQTLWIKRYTMGLREGAWKLSIPDFGVDMDVHFEKDQLQGKAHFWKKSDTSITKEATFANNQCISGDCAYFVIGSESDTLLGRLQDKTLQDFYQAD